MCALVPCARGHARRRRWTCKSLHFNHLRIQNWNPNIPKYQCNEWAAAHAATAFLSSWLGCIQVRYTFNAPASRRIIGYQFTNPHSGKGFTNVFAYEQHRNDAIRAGTLCASLTMRRRTHRRSPGGPSCTCSACSATLPGLDGANNTKRMWMRMLLCQRTERSACCSLQFRWI